MTVFDFEAAEGRWFDVDGGGRICLRVMTDEQNKAIRKATVKKGVEYKKVSGTPARFEFQEVDEDLANVMFWDFVIVGWENFLDKNKEEIPCTKENKIKLISASAKFNKILSDNIKMLTEDEAKAQEAEAKN